MKPLTTTSTPRLPFAPIAPKAWRFSVRCPQADQVMLVIEDAAGFSSWMPMAASNDAAGTWELDLPEAGIAGPVRYYAVEGTSVLNCGTAGLSATRVVDETTVAPTPLVASA